MRTLFVSILLLLANGCTTEPAAVTDVSPEAFLAMPAGSALVLDVRTDAEFSSGHVPGALHISHDALAARLDELGADKRRPVVVYCESGKRAGMAAEVLLDAGFEDVRHLEGDMRAWRESGRPTEVP